MNVKTKICIVLVVFCFCKVFAESEGEKAFKTNNPNEAVLLLEKEVAAGTASLNAYNYLGLSYYQLGDYLNSIDAFTRGLSTPGTNKKILAYNQGNSYYAIKDYRSAIKSYTLALTADPLYYDALLNRANANLMGDDIANALTDYKKYITVVPDDPQRETIERLIAALETEQQNREVQKAVAAQEAERMAEEEKRVQEEIERMRIEDEKRFAEEQERLAAQEAERQRIENEKKALEAERRRKLLEEVANSLQNTDSTNMSAGAEDLIEYDQEAELD